MPSPLAPVKSARIFRSAVPTLVASVSKVPRVVANAFALTASKNALASDSVPTEIVAVPVSLFTVVTLSITSII